MASDRLQRQIDRLLDEAEEAIPGQEWATVGDRTHSVLRLDPENSDALSYLAAANQEGDASLEMQTLANAAQSENNQLKFRQSLELTDVLL